MKIFENKFLVKLIASLCVFLTLLNFGMTAGVHAANDEDDDESGGVLIKPIIYLITGIADGIMDILHNAILSQTETLIKLEGGNNLWWEEHGGNVLGWLVGIAIVAIVMVVTIYSGGAALAAGVSLMTKISGVCFIIKTAAIATVAGAAGGFIVARVVDASKMENDLYLPVFKLTPEEIFANRIPAFDVNFFKPMDPVYVQGNETVTEQIGTLTVEFDPNYNGNTPHYQILIENEKSSNYRYLVEQNTAPESVFQYFVNRDYNNYTLNDMCEKFATSDSTGSSKQIFSGILDKIDSALQEQGYPKLDRTVTEQTDVFNSEWTQTEGNAYKIIIHSKGKTDDQIMSIRVKITEISTTTSTVVTATLTSTAEQLKDVISKWYFILRNLALLVLMLVLIYTGIRIVIGSTAGEKAKYKERLMDWIVAMCLVFIMHYIMVFAVELTEQLISLVDSIDGTNGIIREIYLTNQNHVEQIQDNEELSKFLVSEGDAQFLEWTTDLTGGMRIEQQLVKEGTYNWVGYALCYCILVIYTLIFTWTYLKRIVYMAFLTMIAPLVAMTYPIDKMTDGKAQAFNAWLKEYIFNLLLQPFHLLLYVVLVGSAYELAGQNIIYAIVAIGFMTPAEKLLRRFFGFDKAQTPGLLSGAAGAALAMTGLQNLMGHGSKGKGESKGGHDDDDEKENSGKIKFSSSEGVKSGSGILGTLGTTKGIEGLERAEGSSSISFVNPGIVGAGNTTVNVKEGAETSGAGAVIDIKTGTDKTEAARTGLVRTVAVRTGDNNIVEGGKNLSYTGLGSYTTGKSRSGTGSSSDKRKITIPREIKTIGAGIGAYSRAMGDKIYKRTKKSRPIRSLARGIAGTYGALTFGMAGLALGVASGDPNKAFQYTTAGVAGGFSAGKGLGGAAVDALSVDSKKIQDEMEMDYYGEQYKKIKLQQEKEEMARNEENIDYLRKTLNISRKDAKKILENEGAYCFDSGIRNVEDIATVTKMSSQMVDEIVEKERKLKTDRNEELTVEEENKIRQENTEQALRYTIDVKKFYDRMPNISQMGEKKRGEYQKRFQKEMDVAIRKEIGTEGIEQMQINEMQNLRVVQGKEKEEIEEKIKQQFNKKVSEEPVNVELSDERKKQLENEATETVLREKAKVRVDKNIEKKAKEAAESIMSGATDYDAAKSGLFKA